MVGAPKGKYTAEQMEEMVALLDHDPAAVDAAVAEAYARNPDNLVEMMRQLAAGGRDPWTGAYRKLAKMVQDKMRYDGDVGQVERSFLDEVAKLSGPGAAEVKRDVAAQVFADQAAAKAAGWDSDVSELQRKDNAIFPPSERWTPDPMEPGQFELRTRSYAPFDTFGGGFDGDDRGPTARLDVTSRITQKTLLDTRDGRTGVVRNYAYSDPSHHDSIGTATATPRAGLEWAGGNGALRVKQHLAGANPLLDAAPEIDVDTDVRIRRDGRSLVVEGTMTGDRFPSAEMLLTDAKGRTVLLHSYETDGGAVTGPGRLFGDGGESMGSFRVTIILDADGNFGGVIDPANGKTIPVDDWNRRMTKDA